jgi:hypothetical protein
MEIFTHHLFWAVFFLVFAGLMFLVLKDRLINKKKKLIKVHKKKYHNNYVTAGSNDSGVIFISKMVKASGVHITRHFEYPRYANKKPLDSIRYNGIFDIKVIIDNFTKVPTIEVKGDESFVELIQLSKVNDVLTITHPQISSSSEYDCEITIRTNKVVSFHNKGRGQVDIEGINSETFSMISTAIENVYLAGKAEKFSINSKSNGDVYAQQLKAKVIYVEQNGTGDIYCNPMEALTVRVNDSGNVYVRDMAVTIDKKITDKGRVIYRPFEDTILNFIVIMFQKIVSFIILIVKKMLRIK